MNHNNVISIREHRDKSSRTYIQLIGEVAKNTGTKPFLCVATDDKQYWCKRVESDHGKAAIVNEVTASIVGQRIGAHIRPWKIIYVPDDYVGSFVGDGITRYKLTGTPLFGSENLPTGTLCQGFSTFPFVNDDANPNHIPKLIALWALCNVQEDLQILIDTNDDNSLWSIDHGLWFDSAQRDWQLTPLDQHGSKIRIPRINGIIPEQSWDKAINSLDNLDESLKEELSKALPLEWEIDPTDSDKLIDYVLSRREYTRDLLQQQRQRTP